MRTRVLRSRSVRSAALPALSAMALLAALAGCSGDDTTTASDGGTDPGAGGGTSGGTGIECSYPEDGRDAAREVEAPPTEAAYDGEVPATISLGQGDLSVTLDAAAAPCTVNSFASLAEQGYFADTQCHRLTASETLSVLQCGDPTATGTGGPGYSFADELSGDETYPAGTLAMANAGPDTNGSQFFIVYADSQLPPAYTVFGQIDQEGVDLVSDIAAEGIEGGGPDGAPTQEVTIEEVTVGG